MLSYKLIGSSGQEVGYYASLGKEDYYVHGGEPPGRWCGRGAAKLRLHGNVSGEDLRAILSGRQLSGEKLVQNAGDRKRRAGFDLTWSVPKSVSAALSQAEQPLAKEIEKAAADAVATALETVEEFCGKSRRGKRGHEIGKSGLVAALFRHDTSRGLPGEAPDPNLHFHLVLANVSVREDGTTGAIDTRELFRPHMKMTLGALFRAELSKNLDAIGFTSHRPIDDRGRSKSWFELDAIPQSLIAEFSKRRRQIEHWLRARGQSGAKAAERAAMATRRKKEAYTRDELRNTWQAIGREHGVSNATLCDARRSTTPKQAKAMDAMTVVTSALKLITDDRARFSELELLRYAAQEAQTMGLGIVEIRAAVTASLQNNTEIVSLKEVHGVGQFTTHEMMNIERRMLTTAERTRYVRRHCVTENQASRIIESIPTLRPEQSDAVKHLTQSTGQIACVNGMAGTGKTFLLNVAREVWQDAGFTVIGSALAAKAAKTLEEGSGIESRHLHRLLYEIETQKLKLTEKTVVVLDEAAMVGTKMMDRLLQEIVQASAKLAMVGDHRQLQAISAGAPFRVLAERLGVVELTEITRQRKPWARAAVTELAEGKAESALQRFHDHGDLIIRKNRDEAIEQLVADWHLDFNRHIDARIFAGTRMETATINRLCQHQRKLAGELGTDKLPVGRDVIQVSDRIIVTRNDRVGILKNGMTGTVTNIDCGKNILRILLDDGLQLSVDTNTFDSIELGYCTTTHKGQGQTVESAFILAGGVMTDREISYVQGSRARGRTRFYTDIESGGGDIETLADQMNRSRQKDLAHEYVIEVA